MLMIKRQGNNYLVYGPGGKYVGKVPLKQHAIALERKTFKEYDEARLKFNVDKKKDLTVQWLVYILEKLIVAEKNDTKGYEDMDLENLSGKQQEFVKLYRESLGDKAFLKKHKDPYTRLNILAEKAGYAKGTKGINVFGSKGVREALKDCTREFLEINGPLGVEGLLKVLEEPTKPGNKELLKASTEILDRAGVDGKIKEEQKELEPNSVLIIPAKKVHVQEEG